MPATRLLLCIDDPARRRELADALAGSDDLALVGACEAGEPGVLAAAARRPDAVVVEAGRPGLDGAKLVGRLRGVAPDAGIVAVAAPDDRPRSALARRLVADRYVEPGTAPDLLLDAVVELARDRRDGRVAS